MWDLFVRTMNEKGAAEATQREQATLALSKIFRPIIEAGKLREKAFIPEIGTSLSREGRLAIALNWGNETNRLRVMQGDGWQLFQVQAILDTLTKAEWDFVQGVWVHDAFRADAHKAGIVKIAAFSPEYFALLRARPHLATVLAFATQLVLVGGDQAFEIG